MTLYTMLCMSLKTIEQYIHIECSQGCTVSPMLFLIPVRVPTAGKYKAGKYKCNGEGYKVEINRSQYKMEAYITGKL